MGPFREDVEAARDDGWPPLPPAPSANPYDEDGDCEFCGNRRLKLHAPWCSWADWMDDHSHSSTPGTRLGGAVDSTGGLPM